MNNSFKLLIDYVNNPIGYQEPIRYFKGSSKLLFDLSEVNTQNNPIIKLDIDFNDGSPVITKHYNFNDPQKIVEIITNTYYPYKDTQNIIYYPTFFIKFLHGNQFVYQCPIKISKNSLYTQFVQLDVANAQFIDNSENSLFVIFDTKMGDILNIKIK
jgi:hypothetical protein